MPDCRLTWAEMVQACDVAVMRQVQNIKAGRHHRYGCQQADGWTVNIEGACGEMALAKLLGMFWSGAIGDLSAADVGHLQVRTTAHATGCLVLHPTDKDAEIFVLMVGTAPAFRAAGWCYGHEGKRERFWRDPTGKNRPAFFVPQKLLRPGLPPVERNN
jgi:hypothetical protein